MSKLQIFVLDLMSTCSMASLATAGLLGIIRGGTPLDFLISGLGFGLAWKLLEYKLNQ